MDITKQLIRNNLLEFLEDTGQLRFATRADCVAYCIGYYEHCTALMWKVITELAHEGHIRL